MAEDISNQEVIIPKAETAPLLQKATTVDIASQDSTLLNVQQASKPIEEAEDISTKDLFNMPVDTAQGMSSAVPDLAQKEVVIKTVDTDEPDLAQDHHEAHAVQKVEQVHHVAHTV